MTDRQLMQQALEALEGNCTNPAADPEQAANEDAAIAALRERLAQPEQEPLTDERIFELASEHRDWDRNLIRVRSFARAIEAAHGIKGDA